MEKLLSFINSLPIADREPFAERCGTTIGYLRNACSTKKKMSEGLCLRIATESGNVIKPDDLRPDVDWDYFRKALLASDFSGAKHQSAPTPAA